MAKSIYGIVKAPAASLLKEMPHHVTMDCFDNWSNALAYMKADLESPESCANLSWSIPNPKNPAEPLGIQQCYVVCVLPPYAAEVRSMNSEEGPLKGTPGYIGQVARENTTHFHCVVIGKDISGPTLTVRSYVQGEIEARQYAIKHKQSKLQAEVDRAAIKQLKQRKIEPTVEERNGQNIVDHFAAQLREQGMHEHATQLQRTFNGHFIGSGGYNGDGKMAAYQAIHSIFDKVSREAVQNDNFELATSARNISKMADDMMNNLREEAMDRAENESSHLSYSEASKLLGYNIEDEIGIY